MKIHIGTRQMLPPPGESVPVTVTIESSEERVAQIAEVTFTDPRWRDFVDPEDLIRRNVPSGETTCQLWLRNPVDKQWPGDAESANVQMEIALEWTPSKDRIHRELTFELHRFPIFEGHFALDFGNTNSSCATLPLGKDIGKVWANVEAVDFSGSSGHVQDHSVYASAIQFQEIRGGKVTNWDVGNLVANTFNQLIQRNDPKSLEMLETIYPSGAKRLIGIEKPMVTPCGDERVGERTGEKLTGDAVSGMVIEKLIRKSEAFRLPGSSTPLGRIRKVIATHPVGFTPRQVDALRKLIEATGAVEVDLSYDEATAAAIYYLVRHFQGRPHYFWAMTDSLPLTQQVTAPVEDEIMPLDSRSELHEFNLLVFDCGGGTTDIALIRVDIDRSVEERDDKISDNVFEISPNVVGLTARRSFGGDNMTLEYLRCIRARIARRIAELLPAESGELQTKLEAIPQHDRERVIAAVTRAKNELGNSETLADSTLAAILPTAFAEVDEGREAKEKAWRRRMFYQLWYLAEKLKIRLSAHDGQNPAASQTLDLQDFTIWLDYGLEMDQLPKDIVIDRSQVDPPVRKELEIAWKQARSLCDDAEKKTIVNQIILSGNASAYPLVQEVMRDVFADGKVFRYQPNRVLFDPHDAKLAVAKGAVLARWMSDNRASTINKSDETMIDLRFNKSAILPYTLRYSNAGSDEGLELLPRGTSLSPPREKEVAYQPMITVYQVIGGHEKIALCRFEPPAVPQGVDRAEATIVVRVDQNREISARFKFASSAGVHDEPLERKPILDETEVSRTDPHGGFY